MGILKEISTVMSVALPIQENWTVSRCRYTSGVQEGRRLCIATGVHGDEMMGQLVAYGVAQRIMAEPDALCGTVDIYPMLNPLGMDIGERMVPAGTRLDMNRSFPGAANGTPMEAMCHHVMQDMLGADLVLDVHSSAPHKSEMYEVRMNVHCADKLMEHAKGLCPELIWIYPDKRAYDAQLSSALCMAGTPAMNIVLNERIRFPKESADAVVEGIFHQMKKMGMWTGSVNAAPKAHIPCVRTQADVCRVTCSKPGMYVPEYCLGEPVERGALLGVIIDALQGTVLEEVHAPVSGLVFSQRDYSAVYPGTLIARLCRKE